MSVNTAPFAPDLTTFFGAQLASIVQNAHRHGIATASILEEASKALAPLVVEDAIKGFASSDEGLRELLSAEGGCVPLSEARKLYRKPLGISRQALNEQIKNGKLIAYKSGGGTLILPVWQFRPEGGTLEGLEEVLTGLREKIPGYGPMVPFTFFLQEHPVTGGKTPLDALRAGKLDQVLAAVRADAG